MPTVTTVPVTVVVQVQTARDAYQIAQAEGFLGTRPEWLASLVGPAGTPGKTWINITLADYDLLTTEQKEDETKIHNITDFV